MNAKMCFLWKLTQRPTGFFFLCGDNNVLTYLKGKGWRPPKKESLSTYYRTPGEMTNYVKAHSNLQ